MGGDGMQGLALAIFGAIVLIIAVAVGLAVFLARMLARRRGLPSSQGRRLGLGMGLAGAVIGLVIVSATFFESTFDPPPQVRFVTPPGFRHDWVVLLEDPRATTQIRWDGVDLPFFGKHAQITLPPSGILRVKDLGPIAGRADLDVRWSDGSQHTGSGGGPAPEATGARLYAAFDRVRSNYEPGTQLPLDQTAFGAYILSREQATK